MVPPSITYSVPVIDAARGETRNATRSATSLGRAGRPGCLRRQGGRGPHPRLSRILRPWSLLEGRWKLLILFHLFGGKILRFSELERAIPAISQKMLIQQLRQMENDGIVRRIVHHQVPPKVEYAQTDWGQALCPALDALLKWAALREQIAQDDP